MTSRIVAPRSTRNLVSQRLSEVENLRLRLYVLLPDRGDSDTEHSPTSGTYLDIETGINNVLKSNEVIGKELALRQWGLLDELRRIYGPSRSIGPITMVLSENYVAGLSEANSLENGMSLLRPWGLPYVADSAVKAVLRQTLGEVFCGLRAKSEAIDEVIETIGLSPIFGSNDHPGWVTFFDALPGGIIDVGHRSVMSDLRLETDVMTPHYSKYYEDPEIPPAGYYNPKPIHFLTVKHGTHFIFSFFLRPELDIARLFPIASQDAQQRLAGFGVDGSSAQRFLETLLVLAGWLHGFGSQTGKGFGRMKLASKATE